MVWCTQVHLGASRWLSGKRTLQCRRHRFDLWPGKIPWRRAWQPTCLENPMDWGAWRATVRRAAESRTLLQQVSMYVYVKYSSWTWFDKTNKARVWLANPPSTYYFFSAEVNNIVGIQCYDQIKRIKRKWPYFSKNMFSISSLALVNLVESYSW